MVVSILKVLEEEPNTEWWFVECINVDLREVFISSFCSSCDSTGRSPSRSAPWTWSWGHLVKIQWSLEQYGFTHWHHRQRKYVHWVKSWEYLAWTYSWRYPSLPGSSPVTPLDLRCAVTFVQWLQASLRSQSAWYFLAVSQTWSATWIDVSWLWSWTYCWRYPFVLKKRRESC